MARRPFEGNSCSWGLSFPSSAFLSKPIMYTKETNIFSTLITLIQSQPCLISRQFYFRGHITSHILLFIKKKKCHLALPPGVCEYQNLSICTDTDCHLKYQFSRSFNGQYFVYFQVYVCDVRVFPYTETQQRIKTLVSGCSNQYPSSANSSSSNLGEMYQFLSFLICKQRTITELIPEGC